MGQATSCLGDDRITWTVSFKDDDEKSIQLIRNGSGNQKMVAVTGANGFIGSHIVKLLLAKGYKVRGTVHHPNPHKRAQVDFLKVLPNAAKNLTLHEKDLMHDGCFDDVFQGCDCVFHLASPTLKDQRDMKEPEVDMIKIARFGTLNVLKSCKKHNVSTVVQTSSMCTAIPKTNVPSGGPPDIIYESHWADPDFLMQKGSYYAASKTLAEWDAYEFVNKMSKDSAIRLVRICPCFTVGPMLQNTVNSSMERFARICEGKHHEQIPNRSISVVDVRDTAAHHIAAYELGWPEGRFFSVTEGWPWTLVYSALKIQIPEMKCPKALSSETEHRPVRKFNKSRMKALGVTERSFHQVLCEAVEEHKRRNIISRSPVQCHRISNIPPVLARDFVKHAGYYGSVQGDSKFVIIEAISSFNENQNVSYSVYISWFFPDFKKPKVMQVMANSKASFDDGKLTVAVYGIALIFTSLGGSSSFSVDGKINGQRIKGRSFTLSVPFNHFGGTYSANDGTTVTLKFGGTNNTISLSKSPVDSPYEIVTDFIYNPSKRVFEYLEENDNETIKSRLYLNVAAGHGLRVSFVQFNPMKLPGTTKFLYLSNNWLDEMGVKQEQTGAKDLAAFAGFYEFPKKGFVSIVGKTEGTSKETVEVGINLDGTQAVVYTSFNFDNSTNTLTFPQNDNITLKFDQDSRFRRPITTVTTGQRTATNYFTPAPLSALGPFTLKGHDKANGAEYSLQITIENDVKTLAYTKNNENQFEPTTMFVYNAVEQVAVVGEYVFNLTANANKSITCAVTTRDEKGEPTGLQSVVSFFPDTIF